MNDKILSVPLYKYLPLEFAKLLTESGKIKISTLSKYHNEEKYGEDIGDVDEGTLTEWSELDNSDGPIKTNRVIESAIGSNVQGHFRNCIVATKHKAYDYYIYSMSKLFDLSLMRKFSSDYSEKYDACIKITNPVKFFDLINKTLGDRANYQVSAICKYGNRKKHHEKAEVHPVLLKPLKHEYQAEVRTVWSFVDKEEPEDIFLEIPELTDFCELYFIDKIDITDGFLGNNRLVNKKFQNDSVLLDEHIFDGCTFDSCRLVFRGGYLVHLGDSKFNDCKVILDGSALRTTNFLKFVRNEAGGGGIVDSIIDDIRSVVVTK